MNTKAKPTPIDTATHAQYQYIDAISFISSVLGRCAAQYKNANGCTWNHDALEPSEYAAHLELDGGAIELYVNEELPEKEFLLLCGFARHVLHIDIEY